MHGREALEGSGILDEISGPAGLLLWQSVRDVTLWAATPQQRRAQLFSPDAERLRTAALLALRLEPQLEPPLAVFAAMLRRPGTARPERLASACRQVALWAEPRGKLATALAFAQAAALAHPAAGAAALKVGQLARKRAEYARAETWFRRAIALSRQEGDWGAYALAFVALGNLYNQRGNLPAARRFHLRGYRAAKRNSLRDVQGRALHNLHVVATAAGNVEQAQQYAKAALEAYRSRHPLLPKLAHDVAYFWLTQGHFLAARDVFQALLRAMSSTYERMVVLANLARLAGAIDDRASFDDAWRDFWELPIGENGEGVAEALLELAHGACSLKEWDRAERAGSRAAEIASLRGEGRILLTAESVLDAVRHHRCAEPRLRSAATVDAVQGLAEDFVQSLNSYADATGPAVAPA